MGKSRRELYDLVAVGGGPAGAVAAFRAAKQGAAALVVEREKPTRNHTRVGWLGPAAVALCKECGVAARKAGAAEFAGVRLHSWDLKRSAEVDDPELCGWLGDLVKIDQALLKAAAAAGADTRHGATVRGLDLGEERATLHLSDGKEVAGKLVIIADGVTSPTGRMAKLACAAQQPDVPHCAFVQYETKRKATGLDVAIGASRTGQLATIVRLGTMVSLSIIAREAQTPLDEQFRAFRAQALESELLPAGVPERPSRWLSPGGIALDMDTHVGKRCLLVGDAGGFVAAFSGEGVYPAMRSGWIAADAALRALEAPVLQDELATFGADWRGELADYLRMPNTDLSLLVPLVFNNEQMSRRVARAFLLGQTF